MVDLIWTSLNNLRVVRDLRVLPLATLSDHLPVALYLCELIKNSHENEVENAAIWKLKFDKLKSAKIYKRHAVEE